MAAAAMPNHAKVEAELKRMTNELLDAIAPGDVAVWKKYTHDRLIYVSEGNQELTKKQGALQGGIARRVLPAGTAEDSAGPVTAFVDRREGLDIRWVKLE